MFEQLVLLFTEMTWLPAILLISGLILVIIEIFQPGFGIFGGLGALLTILGVVIRVTQAGSNGNIFALLFYQLLIITLIIVIAFLIMIRSAKKGLLKRSPIIEDGLAVNSNFSEATKDYSYLIGKKGISTTILRPSGFASIDGKTYDVSAENQLIAKDTLIVVEEVEGIKIIVKECE